MLQFGKILRGQGHTIVYRSSVTGFYIHFLVVPRNVFGPSHDVFTVAWDINTNDVKKYQLRSITRGYDTKMIKKHQIIFGKQPKNQDNHDIFFNPRMYYKFPECSRIDIFIKCVLHCIQNALYLLWNNCWKA